MSVLASATSLAAGRLRGEVRRIAGAETHRGRRGAWGRKVPGSNSMSTCSLNPTQRAQGTCPREFNTYKCFKQTQ